MVLTQTEVLLIYETVLTFAIGILVTVRYILQRRLTSTRPRIAQNVFVLAGYLAAVGIWIGCVWAVAVFKEQKHHPSPHVVPGFGLPPDKATAYEKWSLADDYLQITVVWCVKAALMTAQYDMAIVLSKRHRQVIYAASIFMFISYAISMLTLALYCHGHLTDAWSYTKRCNAWHVNSLLHMQYAFNLAGDLIILVLYVVIIRSLSITGRSLIPFLFMLFVACITITASTVRCAEITILNRGRISKASSEKLTRQYGVWAQIEYLSALIVVCLPALRSYFQEKFEFGQMEGREARQKHNSIPLVLHEDSGRDLLQSQKDGFSSVTSNERVPTAV